MTPGVDIRGSAHGRYANYFMLGHNAFEFVLDFGQLYGDGETADMHTRIITGPVYAKALLRLLGDAIAQHEGLFGRIAEGDGPR